MDYNHKKIKWNKKVKLKSLKQIMDICLEKKMQFSVDEKGNITVTDSHLNDVTFKKRQFSKDILIDEVHMDFGYMSKTKKPTYITFWTKDSVFEKSFSVFFNRFPKLSKDDLAVPVIPPPPKVINTLPAGEGHSIYEMKKLDDGTLEVGCNKFTKKQLKNIKEFLKD